MSTKRLTAKERATWLHLRDEGGWWKPSEVARSFNFAAVHRDTTIAAEWLETLLAGKHVIRRDDRVTGRTYGVTFRCIPIAGETLEPCTV